MQLENIIGESLEFLSCLCLGSGLTLLLQSDTRREEGLATLNALEKCKALKRKAQALLEQRRALADFI
jgi:hypothetical protein